MIITSRFDELKRFGLRSLKHATVRNALILYAVQLSTYAFPLITLPYLSRVLSPEKFGLVGYAQNFAWYFYTLTEYGFDLSATRRVAVNRDDPEALSDIFSSVMGAKILLTAIGFTLLCCVVFATPKFRAEWPLFLITFLTVISALLFPLWLYQGMEKMGFVALRDFAAKVLGTILVFVLVKHQSDYMLAAAIQSGSMAIAGLIGLLSVPKLTGVRVTMPKWSEITRALREGWPVFLSMAALTMGGNTSIVILGYVAKPAEVGYYMASYRLMVAARMMVVPVVTAIYPRISHMAANSAEATVRFLRRYSLILASPFLLGSLILFFGAPLIVRKLFGPAFGPTVPILRLMAFSPFLLSLAHSYTTYYMLAFGYDKQWTRIVITTTVLNLIFVFPAVWIMPPAIGIAVLGLVLEIFGLASAYVFYLQHTRHIRSTQPSFSPSLANEAKP